MPPALPPYALAAPAFRFRALAALAGRAPLGGPREVVLACFVGARLAVALAPGSAPPLEDEGRASRAVGARAWLAAAALPAAVRVPLARLIDLTARPVRVDAEAEAAPPRRRVRKTIPAGSTVRGAAAAPPAPRTEVAAAVAGALAVVVAAAEPWLDQPSRQELLQLARELDPTRGLQAAPAPRGAPLSTVGA